MKSVITCLIVGMFVLSGLGAVAKTSSQTPQIIIDSVSFSVPRIQESERYVTVDLQEATSSSMETGKPVLPVVTKVYTFPFGTQIQDVEVTFSQPVVKLISKPVMPAPAPRYRSIELASKQSASPALDVEVYNSDALYPSDSFGYRAGAGLNGETHVIYLAVHYCPITYSPLSNSLYITDYATISITYIPPTNPRTFSEEFDLLILAPAEYQDALQPLIDFKNTQGTLTTLTTLEEIPSVGADKQEDIKYYIKDAIETSGITYVLLVGSGVKNAEKFPVRYAYVPSGGYEESFPSDLYYADVYNFIGGFASWDFDGDGKHSELPDDILSVDLYPDVYLARLPCNDVSEVKTAVQKTINFIKNNKQKGTILQMGGDSFVEGDDEEINEGELANTNVMGVLPGYQTTQLWGSNGQLTKFNIIKGWFKGVDFVDFNGHGSPISWATHPPQDENTWIPAGKKWSGFTYIEVYWLFNFQKLPVIFINACSTNKFSESDTCLGWSFIKKKIGGGIAAWGASGIGYGVPGSMESEWLFGWMELHTFEYLYSEKVVGDAWGSAVTNYVNEFGGLFIQDVDYKTVEEYSLFADPSLPINQL